MTTESLYVIGGAGVGKSTFTQALLDRSNASPGPLLDLHQKPNSRGTVITLRGHQIGVDGMYLGRLREEHPGTDGLDRVSYIPGEDWLRTTELPRWILAEGATLSVHRFLKALGETTDLLVVHLVADEFVTELRCAERGTSQKWSWVLGKATEARNLATKMEKEGVRVREVDSANRSEWDMALDAASKHLGF